MPAMKIILIPLLFLFVYSQAQCPTRAEREERVEWLLFKLFLDKTFPASVLEIPAFIDFMSEYLTEDATFFVPYTGSWTTPPIFLEYVLLSRDFVGRLELISAPAIGDYEWVDDDTVLRLTYWEYRHQTAAPGDTVAFDLLLTWRFSECSLVLSYTGFEPLDLPYVQKLGFDGHPADGVFTICGAIAGAPDGSAPGFCGPVDNRQTSVVPAAEDTTVYDSFWHCVEVLSSKPITCNDLNSIYKGDTILCRMLHGFFVTVDPGIHCGHVAPESDVCKPEDCTDMPAPQCTIWDYAYDDTVYDCANPECIWNGPYSDTYLGGYACDSKTYDDLIYAQHLCCICDECAGVTQDRNGEYSLRTGPKKLHSYFSEMSWTLLKCDELSASLSSQANPAISAVIGTASVVIGRIDVTVHVSHTYAETLNGCHIEMGSSGEIVFDLGNCTNLIDAVFTDGDQLLGTWKETLAALREESLFVNSDPSGVIHGQIMCDGGCPFGDPVPGSYLSQYACTTTDSRKYTDLRDAQNACCDCGECSGVTCNGGVCTIRKGPYIEKSWSPAEISYRKPVVMPAGCTFGTEIADTYLRGFACNSRRYLTIEEAMSACCTCADCAGITFDSNRNTYTTRMDDPRSPGFQESSWMRV